MPGYLDDLLGKTVQLNNVSVPDRKRLNFVGASVSVADNPANLSTDVTITGVGTSGKDPMTAQSNSGTPAYPTNPTNAIAPGMTFVRTAVADHDSIRIFGAGGGEPSQVAFLFGRLLNVTAYVLDFYPLITQHIYLLGVDQGAGNPIEIAPGATLNWSLDVSLNLHVSS